jgi:hypothetical protein
MFDFPALLHETRQILSVAHASDLEQTANQLEAAAGAVAVITVGGQVPSALLEEIAHRCGSRPSVHTLSDYVADPLAALRAGRRLLVVAAGQVLDGAGFEAAAKLVALPPRGSVASVIVHAGNQSEADVRRAEMWAFSTVVDEPPQNPAVARASDYRVFMWCADGALPERYSGDAARLAAWLKKPAGSEEFYRCALLTLAALLGKRLAQSARNTRTAADGDRRDVVLRLRTTVPSRIDAAFEMIERQSAASIRGMQTDLAAKIVALLQSGHSASQTEDKFTTLLAEVRSMWEADCRKNVAAAFTGLEGYLFDEIGDARAFDNATATEIVGRLELVRHREALARALVQAFTGAVDDSIAGAALKPGSGRSPAPSALMGAVVGGAIAIAVTAATPFVMPFLSTLVHGLRLPIIGAGAGLGAFVGHASGQNRTEAAAASSRQTIAARAKLALDNAMQEIGRAIGAVRRDIQHTLAEELDSRASGDVPAEAGTGPLIARLNKLHERLVKD